MHTHTHTHNPIQTHTYQSWVLRRSHIYANTHVAKHTYTDTHPHTHTHTHTESAGEFLSEWTVCTYMWNMTEKKPTKYPLTSPKLGHMEIRVSRRQ